MIAMILALVTAAQPAAAEAQDDPLDARFVYSDVERFWELFDRLADDPENNPFHEYLERGTSGLRDFVPGQRIVSAEALYERVTSEMEYYAAVRPSTLKARAYESHARASFLALEELYPDAVFPPVYYLIGRVTAGGTSSENGVLVALEIFTEETVTTTYGRPSFPLEILPGVVAHELVHFLQSPHAPDEAERTLLEQSLVEGAANFISELIAGKPVDESSGARIEAYGEEHEAELWAEFRQVMHDTEYGPWLYSRTEDGRPQNLGYWMGYQIVESFYDQAEDKRAAVREIIEMDDAEAFLERSGYAGGR